GIVANLPIALGEIVSLPRLRDMVIPIFLMAALVIVFVVVMERAQRRIHIQYPKRQVGNRMSQGETSHLPLKLNPAGVIPAIFASSVLLLPVTILNFMQEGGAGWLRTLSD